MSDGGGGTAADTVGAESAVGANEKSGFFPIGGG